MVEASLQELSERFLLPVMIESMVKGVPGYMFEDLGRSITARVPQARALEIEAPGDWQAWVVAPSGHGTPIMVSIRGVEVLVECGVFALVQDWDASFQPEDLVLLIETLVDGDWTVGITSAGAVATEISFGRNTYRSGDWTNVVVTHAGSRWGPTDHT